MEADFNRDFFSRDLSVFLKIRNATAEDLVIVPPDTKDHEYRQHILQQRAVARWDLSTSGRKALGLAMDDIKQHYNNIIIQNG